MTQVVMEHELEKEPCIFPIFLAKSMDRRRLETEDELEKHHSFQIDEENMVGDRGQVRVDELEKEAYMFSPFFFQIDEDELEWTN
jgi:hypothetical protein